MRDVWANAVKNKAGFEVRPLEKATKFIERKAGADDDPGHRDCVEGLLREQRPCGSRLVMMMCFP